MKKIALFFGLVVTSLTSFAQQSPEQSIAPAEKVERSSSYIIVLDETKVENNIDMLLNGHELSEEMTVGFHSHELAHDVPVDTNIENNFIEGAYSFNEYASTTPKANGVNTGV